MSLVKIFVDENFFEAKIQISDQHFNFGGKLKFLRKIKIFYQHFTFDQQIKFYGEIVPKFKLLTKIS